MGRGMASLARKTSRNRRRHEAAGRAPSSAASASLAPPAYGVALVDRGPPGAAASPRGSAGADPEERAAEAAAERVVRGEKAAGDPARRRAPSSSTPGGRSLDPAVRAPMEAGFGVGLSGVRVHTGTRAARAAQALNARAYTLGGDIVFGAGQYAPQTGSGRKLLAHEVAHAVRDSGTGAPGGAVVRRQQATPTPQVTAPISIARADETTWVGRVDAAVRSRYGLRGARMTASRVRFLDQAGFASHFPAASIEERLLELFLSPPAGSNIHTILRAHHVSLAGVARMRRFVRRQVQAGFFNSTHVDPIQGRMVTVRHTPREILAQSIGGTTTVSPNRRQGRRVFMQRGQDVETLVHEACHFYVSNAFRNMAGQVPNRGHLRRGLGIEHTLMEGFAEWFARDVMRANAATFGPMRSQAYPFQYDEVSRYIVTVGRRVAERAYFHGDSRAIATLRRTLVLYETTHPDLIEPWPG